MDATAFPRLEIGRAGQPQIEGLTVSGHSDSETLFEAAVLTPVAVESDDEAFAVAETAVLDLLLNTPSEEALASFARGHPIVIA